MNIYTGSGFICGADDRDQASVFAQIGLLETDKLPIYGVETAMKLLDEKSVESNLLLKNWKESEGKPI